jgi:dTDP-4-amino-4,6-dideoxygalactose transaminase
MTETIPFIDLVSQRRRLGRAIDQAIARVTAHGRLILGPEVEAFEAELAGFCGAGHCVSCASGTDALMLALRAKSVGPGDAVIVPAFTFASTAEVVAGLHATPVFVDVEERSFSMGPAALEAGIAAARRLGLNLVAAVPVDMFGQPADYDALEPVACDAGLWLLADAAQGFGGSLNGRRVGTFGCATGVSFYPSKPLGAYGDGGAILTDDSDLAECLRSLRNHGAGEHPYDHVRIGVNSRLDAIQAAVLRAKLAIFPDEIGARNEAARYYGAGLRDVAIVPELVPGATSVWAQYTLRVRDREGLRAHLASAGIPTAVHYPLPLHRQPAFRGFPLAGDRLPVAERIAAEVVSLPMHGYLTRALQDRIIDRVRSYAALDSEGTCAARAAAL